MPSRPSHCSGRVHIGAPRASKRTKVTLYVKLPFPVARTRALSFMAPKGWWATSLAFGRGRFDRHSCFEVTQSRPGRVIERSRAAVDTQQFFRAELNSRVYENRACAYTHAPSTSSGPSRLSSNTRACHFASRRVSCVVAKATVDVGLASPFSSPRAAVARRAPAVSLDGATSVGVVIFDSVVLVIVVVVRLI